MSPAACDAQARRREGTLLPKPGVDRFLSSSAWNGELGPLEPAATRGSRASPRRSGRNRSTDPGDDDGNFVRQLAGGAGGRPRSPRNGCDDVKLFDRRLPEQPDAIVKPVPT